MAYTWGELQAKSRDELIQIHDEFVTRIDDNLLTIRQEIARKDAHAQGRRMVLLTGVMAGLTVVITVLTIVNVLLVAGLP